MNISGLLDSVGRDLRYALRSLPRPPAFQLAAVLTLGLGIGATTAIFSVVYSVLIKPLPYPNADELVRIRQTPSASISMISTRAQTCTLRTGRRTGRWPASALGARPGAADEDVPSTRASTDRGQCCGGPRGGRGIAASDVVVALRYRPDDVVAYVSQ